MGAALDNTAEVDTPESVRFRYQVAGPVRRGLAYIVDLAIRAVALAILWTATSLALGTAKRFSTGIMLLALFLFEWGYYVFFETTGGGRTPGKRAFSLRMVKEGGFPAGFMDSVLRNLLRGADFLPVGYVLGVLVMASDARFRRLGDRVAGTLVVIEARAALAAPLVLSPPISPDEIAGVSGRPRLTVQERETLELFLRRADLTAARREELAATIAPVLVERMGGNLTYRDPVRFLALVHDRATSGRAPQAG